MKKKVGLIRVMILSKDQCTSLEKKLEDIFPELEIRTESIPEQPRGIEKLSYRRTQRCCSSTGT